MTRFPALAALVTTLGLALAACSGPGTPGTPGTPLPAGPDGRPSASAPLAMSPDGRTLWVVNPDADSVTAVDTDSWQAAAPLAVGQEPWAVAVAPNGTVVVMNRADGTLTLLANGRRDDVPVGPEPGGLTLSPNGRTAYVTVSSADELVLVDVASGAVRQRVPLGRMPWAVAVTDDGDEEDDDETIVVTHRLARLAAGGAEGEDDGKEGWLTLLAAASATSGATTSGTASRGTAPTATGGAASALMTRAGLDPEWERVVAPYAFGYPNGLEGLAVHGDQAYVAHLLNAPAFPRDFETTVSAAVSSVGLPDSGAERPLRLHLNEESFSTPVNGPVAVALSPQGTTAYVVLAGSDAVMGVDLSDPDAPNLIGFWPTGANPRGIVLNESGSLGYVMNYLSRDVSVLDLEDHQARLELARVRVAPETLPEQMLRGKVLFHLAASSRISQLGWISCASCHLGGGSDGTTWHTPDGPRQTQPLWNLRGTAPFHASATRDEVQDFERDIEEMMAGSGLAPGAFRTELGEPNGGLSEDLDALAAFVLDGFRVPEAAPVAPGAAASVTQGRALFQDLGCASCHGGPSWTISALPGPVGALAPNGEVEVLAVLRDVGTYDPTRDVLGAAGFDVPTLLGLHATAPYLHDGSAATLEEVLENPVHTGRMLSEPERLALAAFLRTVDARTPTF